MWLLCSEAATKGQDNPRSLDLNTWVDAVTGTKSDRLLKYVQSFAKGLNVNEIIKLTRKIVVRLKIFKKHGGQ